MEIVLLKAPANITAEWRHGEVSGKIACPVQLVHGLSDDFVRPHHSEARFNALANAPHKNLWLVEGAAHTRCYALASEEYHRRLVSFFRRYLGR